MKTSMPLRNPAARSAAMIAGLACLLPVCPAAAARNLTTIASFDITNGTLPESAVTIDAAGNLHSTTQGGGAYGDGTAFEIVRGSDSITTLASFNSADGLSPHSGLTLGPAGNLYGTTYQGGAGTVFELTPAFDAASAVPEPSAGLLLGAAGTVLAPVRAARRRLGRLAP